MKHLEGLPDGLGISSQPGKGFLASRIALAGHSRQCVEFIDIEVERPNDARGALVKSVMSIRELSKGFFEFPIALTLEPLTAQDAGNLQVLRLDLGFEGFAFRASEGFGAKLERMPGEALFDLGETTHRFEESATNLFVLWHGLVVEAIDHGLECDVFSENRITDFHDAAKTERIADDRLVVGGHSILDLLCDLDLPLVVEQRDSPNLVEIKGDRIRC